MGLLLWAHSAGTAPAAPRPVFHASLQAAAEAATSDQSLVLLIFGADWCAPCKQLNKTLSAPEFLDEAGAWHVVDLDVDTEGKSAARDYGVTVLPTLVVQTPDNKIVTREEGLMDTAALLDWLQQARERVKQGKWEGTAPGSKLQKFIDKAASDQLDTNDIACLIALLGEPGAPDRDATARLLVEQRDLAVLPLIRALTNGYLGVRIAASETLHRLAPDTPLVDAWQGPMDLAQTVSDLTKWWATAGKLPLQSARSLLDSNGPVSLRELLSRVGSEDPVQATEAMSRLVAYGAEALPELREAIQSAEKQGNQRALAHLEDVRWAILVPDEVEQRTGGVRAVLARGKGPDRQAAAGRLGQCGRLAIPALAELANDADTLVVEAAVRALSKIGGKDSVPAMAALLRAQDSNLRMTAVEALGHTRNTTAIKDLLPALKDANEVVVCAALSALDEISGERDYSPLKQPPAPEVSQAVKVCLADSRWRVRAAAAELTGKLAMNDLVDDLNRLLTDADGFVVKNAMQALGKLGAAPEPQKLLAVVRQHSDLAPETVGLLVDLGTDDAVNTVTALYDSRAEDGRIAVIHSLGRAAPRNAGTNAWQPLLAKAARESNPRVRLAVAQMLATQPSKLAASLVGDLLSDPDRDIRSAAAGVVLSVIGRERQVLTGPHGTVTSQFVSVEELAGEFPSSNKGSNTNDPPATAQQMTAWHACLRQTVTNTPDLLTAGAFYVTGSTNDDLPVLQAALERADKANLNQLSRSAAMAAIIPHLPWPAGRPIVERCCASPALFLKMIGVLQSAVPALGDFLLEPNRFRAAVDPASPDDLESSLERLIGAQQRGWSLFSNNPRTQGVVCALLQATNAVWRAAAVYSLGFREEPKAQAYLEHALGDTDSWVRLSAVLGLARAIKDRAVLEHLLGPMVSDGNKKVAEKAMICLLEPETRSAASLDYVSGYFEFEKVHIWSSGFEPNGEQRPLATLPGNPAFLQVARQNLGGASVEEIALPALLLAQYGDFSGLDQVLKGKTAETQSATEGMVLAAVGLSRDAKYLPYLKPMVTSAKQEQDLRRLLQALRGMTGAETRELRLEINKRLRQGRD